MEMRLYGRTGMQLSVLGFGCGAVDRCALEHTIARALVAGRCA